MKLDHIGDVIVSFRLLFGVVLFGVVIILHLVAVCTLSRHLYFLYLWLSFIIYLPIQKKKKSLPKNS
jgi:hypothetical protein